MGRQFVGEGLREPAHRTANAVAQSQAFERLLNAGRRDEQDGRRIRLAQCRQRRLDEMHGAHEGELKRRLPLVLVELCEDSSGRTAGVDNQRVEPAELGDCVLHCAPDLSGVRDVRGSGDDADAMCAHRVGSRLQCLVRARAHADIGTLGSELFGDGTPHALARRRDERGASAKPEIHGWDTSSLLAGGTSLGCPPEGTSGPAY